MLLIFSLEAIEFTFRFVHKFKFSSASRNWNTAGTIFLGLVFVALFIGIIAFTHLLMKDR